MLESLWEEMILIKTGQKEFDDDEKKAMESFTSGPTEMNPRHGSLIDAVSDALQIRISFGKGTKLGAPQASQPASVPGTAVGSLAAQAAFRVLAALFGLNVESEWTAFSSYFDTSSAYALANTVDYVLSLLPPSPHHPRVFLLCIDEIHEAALQPLDPQDNQLHHFLGELVNLALCTLGPNRQPVLGIVHLAGTTCPQLEPFFRNSVGKTVSIPAGLVARKYIDQAFDSYNQLPPPGALAWTPPSPVATWTPSSSIPRVLNYIGGHFRSLDDLFEAQGKFGKHFFPENSDVAVDVAHRFLAQVRSKYAANPSSEGHGIVAQDAFRIVAAAVCFGLPKSRVSTLGYDATQVDRLFQEAIELGVVHEHPDDWNGPLTSSWLLLDCWTGASSAGPLRSFPFHPNASACYWQDWEVLWAKYLALRAHLWSVRTVNREPWTTPCVASYLDGVQWGQQEYTRVPRTGAQRMFASPQIDASAFQLNGDVWPAEGEVSLDSLNHRSFSQLKPADETLSFAPNTSAIDWQRSATRQPIVNAASAPFDVMHWFPAPTPIAKDEKPNVLLLIQCKWSVKPNCELTIEDVKAEYNKVEACMQPLLDTTAWYLLVVTNKTHNLIIPNLPHNVGILDRVSLPVFLGPIAHAFLGEYVDAPIAASAAEPDPATAIGVVGAAPEAEERSRPSSVP